MTRLRSHIIIAIPIQVNGLGQVDHMTEDLAGFVKGLGYTTIESHMVYIHSSLTREIMVYEKQWQLDFYFKYNLRLNVYLTEG
jgi:hypothetical protein